MYGARMTLQGCDVCERSSCGEEFANSILQATVISARVPYMFTAKTHHNFMGCYAVSFVA